MREIYSYILTGKPERMRPLERSRHGWEDNIKMYLKLMNCESVDWFKLGRHRWDLK
jgi:hypothetical protein